MGSIGRVFTMGAEHIRAQSQVDAGRIVQAAYNKNQIGISEAKNLLQTANNVAARDWAAAQTQIRDANNYATLKITGAQNDLITGQNAINVRLTDAYNKTQAGIADARNAAATGIAAAQKQVQDTNNVLAVQVAEAKKVVQAARNERAAAVSSLALWSQSVANQHILDQAGDRIGAVQEDAARQLDASLRGSVSARLQGAEALGAALANAGAAGIGGASVESFSQDIRLRQALQDDLVDRQIATVKQAAGDQRSAILGQAVGQLDMGPVIADMDYSAIVPEGQTFNPIYAEQVQGDVKYADQNFMLQQAQLDYTPFVANQDYEVFSPNLDYTVYVDHKKMGFFQQAVTAVGAAAATYFGGPQAGAAVLDASFAMNDARNGNFAAANQGFNSAFSNAMGGYKSYQKSGAWGANLKG
ncbi:hypothetical protein [Caulobacter phage DCM]|uniref:Internal virion protein n=1 Tax=Caulobacter phage DCM TaxID=3020391 RepID=A0AAE9WX91_9CAUD|nr:hypothetical protein [Caulobacter phage DCM]WCD56123.1 hypothetical protein [Caulobacter phage BL199]